jgi:hypothetical protein
MEWFSWFFGASLVVTVIVGAVVQSRAKWAVLRRVRSWPGVQPTLDTVGRLWAGWVFRRLPTTRVDPRRQQSPPDEVR